MWRYSLAAVFLTLCFGVSATFSEQQPNGTDVVKQVLDVWQKRRQAIKSVIYKVEGTEIYARGSMTEDSPQMHERLRKNYPPEDRSLSTKTEYTIDFPSGKIRKERRNYILNSRVGDFCPRTSIELFDGKKATLYEPRAENTSELYTPVDAQPELVLYKGGTTSIFQPAEYPVLFAHGYLNPYNRAVDAKGFFDRSLEPAIFRFHERGTIGDRSCLVIRTIPEGGARGFSDEFWVDLERDGAVLRWQACMQGTPYSRYDISYQLIDRHWLPQSWQFDLFPTQDGHPVFHRGERIKVTGIQINPSVSPVVFSSPRKHGMVVSNSEGGVFVIASDDRTLVPYGQPTKLWRWWHWFGIAFLCAALFGSFVHWYRRRSQRSS